MKAVQILIVGLSLATFSCQGSQEQKKPEAPPAYKEGIYSAAYETPDSRGWKAFLEVQIRDGSLVSANFDYINADGALKSQDQAYADNMKKATGTTPSDAAKALLDSLVDRQTAEVQAVTGATGTSTAFKVLAEAALKKALSGDAAPALLPQPAE